MKNDFLGEVQIGGERQRVKIALRGQSLTCPIRPRPMRARITRKNGVQARRSKHGKNVTLHCYTVSRKRTIALSACRKREYTRRVVGFVASTKNEREATAPRCVGIASRSVHSRGLGEGARSAPLVQCHNGYTSPLILPPTIIRVSR